MVALSNKCIWKRHSIYVEQNAVVLLWLISQFKNENIKTSCVCVHLMLKYPWGHSFLFFVVLFSFSAHIIFVFFPGHCNYIHGEFSPKESDDINFSIKKLQYRALEFLVKIIQANIIRKQKPPIEVTYFLSFFLFIYLKLCCPTKKKQNSLVCRGIFNESNTC